MGIFLDIVRKWYMALHKPQIYVFTYIPGDRKLRIIYFLVKLRIIFHSTYESGQSDRKTAFYIRNFPGNRCFSARKRKQEMAFFDQEFGVSLRVIGDTSDESKILRFA